MYGPVFFLTPRSTYKFVYNFHAWMAVWSQKDFGNDQLGRAVAIDCIVEYTGSSVLETKSQNNLTSAASDLTF